MTVSGAATCAGLGVRARQSLGASSDAIHRMVAEAIDRHDIKGAKVFDVGCGHGSLRAVLQHRFLEYRGLDAILYSGFANEAEFTHVDLDRENWSSQSRPSNTWKTPGRSSVSWPRWLFRADG
jgi:hypothetical protein